MRTILTAAGIFACILLAGCMQNPAAAASVVSSAPVSAVPMASSAVPAPPVPEDEWVDACFYGSFNGESPPEMKIRPLKLPVGWTDAELLNAILCADRKWEDVCAATLYAGRKKSEDVCAVEQTEKGLVVTMRQPEYVVDDISDCHLYVLDEMAQTLRLHHGPDAQVFFRTEDGGPLTFKLRLMAGLIYEVPVDRPYELCVDWMAQAVAEYPWSAPQYDPADRSWADTVPQAGLAPDDAFGWEIARFLQMVLPQAHWEPETLSFDSPDQAGDAFLKRVGFLLTETLPKFRSDRDADMANPEELRQSVQLWPAFARADFYFVPKHHLEQAVQYVFGDGVTFEHGDFNDKTWIFIAWPGVYNQFAGGRSGGGIYSSVLGYRDLGETVEVEIALTVQGWLGDFLFDTSDGEQITVESEYDTETGKYVYDRERVLELIWTQSPRAAVTLTKKPDGGFWLTGYHYIGYV
ncbi:hypothetical protein [Anaerotruncus colihominis]|uniref:hypothetical protein n=3 Tax=Anaerotruncus colihominis TaxID=169435 RepID=UPI001897C07E|nr:hypothetical protein [Anaerotruncus colihominis]